jgi:hypothetical protein
MHPATERENVSTHRIKRNTTNQAKCVLSDLVVFVVFVGVLFGDTDRL